jgi:hypothetical protein
MTIAPQVEAVHDSGVTGAAGVGPEAEDVDIPPPQALKAAVSKATHAKFARSEHCIEISSLW